MAFVEDTGVYPLLIDIAACVCNEITARDLPPPCFCGVVAGQQVAGEHCGGCGGQGCQQGQLWVRLARIYPSTSFPVEDELYTCAVPEAYQIEIGAMRCAPVIATNGVISGFSPDEGQWVDATRLQMADMAAMKYAILCCLQERNAGVDEWMLGAYEPAGPEGGCVGGIWTLRVAQSLFSQRGS